VINGGERIMIYEMMNGLVYDGFVYMGIGILG
jgi:hypothetical protein